MSLREVIKNNTLAGISLGAKIFGTIMVVVFILSAFSKFNMDRIFEERIIEENIGEEKNDKSM